MSCPRHQPSAGDSPILSVLFRGNGQSRRGPTTGPAFILDYPLATGIEVGGAEHFSRFCIRGLQPSAGRSSVCCCLRALHYPQHPLAEKIYIQQHNYTVVWNLSSWYRHCSHFFAHCPWSRRFLTFAEILSILLASFAPRHRYCRATNNLPSFLHLLIPLCISCQNVYLYPFTYPYPYILNHGIFT